MLKRIFDRIRLNSVQKLRRIIMDPVDQVEKRPAPVTDQPSSDSCKRQKVEGEARLDRKRKCAIMFGYNGKGYYGLQRNPGFITIEEELCKALVDAELIPVEHSEYMQKMSFQRAARTDKGVSAAGNLVSLKMLMNKDNLVDEINKHLPAQIRVYECFRTTQGFNSKNHCDARTYIYVLPTYAFLHKDKPFNLQYRMDADQLERANEVLELFRGTHNFHNYTSGIKASDKSAKRFIIDFECRTPFVREGVEFCVISVKGQSFMMHQIRKMVGTVIAVLKGYVDEEFIQKTFNYDKICLPKVPGLGLVLEKLHYNSYNNRHGVDHRHIDFETIKNKTSDFKEEYILSEIYKTEIEEFSMLKWLPELEVFTFDVEKETDRETNLQDEKLRLREKRSTETEIFLNELKKSNESFMDSKSSENQTLVHIKETDKQQCSSNQDCGTTTTTKSSSTTTSVQDNVNSEIVSSENGHVDDNKQNGNGDKGVKVAQEKLNMEEGKSEDLKSVTEAAFILEQSVKDFDTTTTTTSSSTTTSVQDNAESETVSNENAHVDDKKQTGDGDKMVNIDQDKLTTEEEKSEELKSITEDSAS